MQKCKEKKNQADLKIEGGGIIFRFLLMRDDE